MTERMTPERWATEALKVLAREGLAGVSVERLARKLGVTKGSFYWHYRSRDALVEAALLSWEANNTRALLDHDARYPDPRERLRALYVAAFDRSALGGLLLHLIAERAHPVIGPILRRVTRARLDHLARLYAEAGLDAEDARHQALLAYSAYVGLFQVMAAAPDHAPAGDALEAHVQHMVERLIP